jgi:hypothetical protein
MFIQHTYSVVLTQFLIRLNLGIDTLKYPHILAAFTKNDKQFVPVEYIQTAD